MTTKANRGTSRLRQDADSTELRRASEVGGPARKSESWRDSIPINRVRPAYQQVADQLRELIVTGTLSPGDRLPPEGELSEVFGVSRSTVREALRVLTARDLLVTMRGTTGGTFVSRVQPDQVSTYLETSIGLMTGGDVSVGEVLEAREVLEVPAASLAAHRRTDQHLAAMRQAIESEKLGRERGVKFREHRNFHSHVVNAANNSLLNVMTGPVFRVLQARIVSSDVPEAFWHKVDSDHENIVKMISDRDADGAASAMREHLRRLQDIYAAR